MPFFLRTIPHHGMSVACHMSSMRWKHLFSWRSRSRHTLTSSSCLLAGVLADHVLSSVTPSIFLSHSSHGKSYGCASGFIMAPCTSSYGALRRTIRWGKESTGHRLCSKFGESRVTLFIRPRSGDAEYQYTQRVRPSACFTRLMSYTI